MCSTLHVCVHVRIFVHVGVCGWEGVKKSQEKYKKKSGLVNSGAKEKEVQSPYIYI